MSKYKVIVTARSFAKSDQRAVELLAKHDCEIVRLAEGKRTLREQLEEAIVDADAVIAGLEAYDKDLISRAGKLKVISRYGVGYDKVDVAAAFKKGIQVTITPGANGDSVADLAVTLMLDAARNVTVMDTAMKNRNQVRPQGVEMWQKTLGVIGTGRIGQGVAKRCRGFDMEILGYDIYQSESFETECGGKYVDLEILFKNADFISLHLPLTPETENMISSDQFKVMKADAVIVNTARGGILDEDALYEALKSGEIRAAALDATVSEPPYESPLMSLGNCLLTPHAGAATKEAASKMSYMAAENAITVFCGMECRNRVG